jgi:hypothetical protein
LREIENNATKAQRHKGKQKGIKEEANGEK